MHVLTPILLSQIAGASDTVLTRVVGTHLSTLQKVLAVAEIGAIVLAYALLIGMLLAVLRIAKAIEQAKDKLDDVSKSVHTLVDSGNKIVEKANGIVDSVKSSIDGVHDTVDYANQRAQRAVGDLADSVDEFNRTLTIVRTETQDVVVAALSAMRGVKAGVGALKRRKRSAAEKPPEDANGNGRVEPTGRPRLRRRVPVEG